MLSQQRIERVSVRSQAVYLPDKLPGSKNLVQVTRKMGKWNQFGHMRDGMLYLHPHEALHLIEMVLGRIIMLLFPILIIDSHLRIAWSSTLIQY